MFSPKTEKIKKITERNQEAVERLEKLLGNSTRVYIDYANVRPWSTKLHWHIDLRRLKQFLDSFDTVGAVSFYGGYIKGDERSEREIKQVEDLAYIVRTKPVKFLRFSINASSISADSTALLKPFIRRALLRKYEVSTIEYLNERFADMNKKGEYYIEDRKCNFDVEISTDMLLDSERKNGEIFVLWSGDSDFAEPVKKLLEAGRKVVLCATAGKISSELNTLRVKGLEVFDIFHIKDLICWNREINKRLDKSTKDSVSGAP
ncbi:NYN domain-containing protein [Candidatus Shapirobacteria bacterium]|nr:NYN domain-containing protein [Candidatus Shapirobacteria bacterium]